MASGPRAYWCRSHRGTAVLMQSPPRLALGPSCLDCRPWVFCCAGESENDPPGMSAMGGKRTFMPLAKRHRHSDAFFPLAVFDYALRQSSYCIHATATPHTCSDCTKANQHECPGSRFWDGCVNPECVICILRADCPVSDVCGSISNVVVKPAS